MAKPQLVIIGNGMATGRLLDEILKRGAEAYAITVIGDEVHGSYNRIMLSPVLAADAQLHEIIHKPSQWYSQQGINFIAGQRVERIDRDAKTLETSSGETLSYDELVIATGSRPARIPAGNQQLANIFSFRTIDDVQAIEAAAAVSSSDQGGEVDCDALVVGGGLLGLEAAYGLAKKGLEVVLVHRSAWPLNRQLDAVAGQLLQQVMEQKNIRFELATEVESFVGEDKVRAVQLKNGHYYQCRLAVIATGITPNRELGEQAGLDCRRGIVVDALMRSSDPNISAIGECAEFDGQTYGLVEPIWAHCTTLADRLCLQCESPYSNASVATKLKVSGVQVFSAGDFVTDDRHRELVFSDADSGIYRKLLLEDNRIVGIVLFGDTRDGQAYFELMQSARQVGDIAHLLLLGKAFYQPLLDAPAA